MAQESDQPTSADKGKGKAVEKSKDDKPVANGKKDGQDKKDG
jgi:26S proteasome regulatory subunit N1